MCVMMGAVIMLLLLMWWMSAKCCCCSVVSAKCAGGIVAMDILLYGTVSDMCCFRSNRRWNVVGTAVVLC